MISSARLIHADPEFVISRMLTRTVKATAEIERPTVQPAANETALAKATRLVRMIRVAPIGIGLIATPSAYIATRCTRRLDFPGFGCRSHLRAPRTGLHHLYRVMMSAEAGAIRSAVRLVRWSRTAPTI